MDDHHRLTAGVVRRLGLTALFYAGAFGVWLAQVVREPAEWGVDTAVYGLAIILYAGLSLIAVRRRPGNSQVRVFVATGVAAVLTIVWPSPDFGRLGEPAFYAHLLLFAFVYALPTAVFVHMAALIPRPHPVVTRHPGFIRGAYVLAGLIALASFVPYINVGHPFLPWRWTLEQVVTFDAMLNLVSYAFYGVACQVLLGSAAWSDPSPEGRRQALVVFFGLLPWTLNQLRWLLIPNILGGAPWLAYAAPVTILIVAIGFFIAIAGFQLFNVGPLLRKSLIYGLTMAVLIAVGYLLIATATALATEVLGLEPTIWTLSLLLAAIAGAFRPVAQRIGGGVDRLFYREKLALRDLPGSIIPELAGFTDLGEAGTRLVRRLADDLGLDSAALLVADEGRRFYRVRALTGAFCAPGAAADVVLTAGDLDRCWPGGGRRPFDRNDRNAPMEGAELRRMLNLLEARYVLPIEFRGDLIAVLTLGAVRSGTEFDQEDLREMELLARTVSAMLENTRLFGLATHDALTGLPHRRVFDDRLGLELSRAARDYHPFAIGLIDVDGFKAINDTYGHLVGDQVLRAVAARIAEACRTIDLVARFGGDEIALLLPVTDAEGARGVGEKLRRSIEGVELPEEVVGAAAVTLSIGFYVVRPEDVRSDPTELLRRADAALYAAKREGRDRVHVDAPDTATERV